MSKLCPPATRSALVLCGSIASMLFLSEARAADPAAEVTASQLKRLSLEELMRVKVETVTTASKLPEKATATPGTTIVITAQDIRLRGYSQLTDVLRDLPGMETTEFFHSEVGTSVAVRGLVGNNKIIVLVNGMRVNPPGGEEIRFGSDFSVRNAQQIEVIYGPGSTLYGQDAISAVINIKTKQAAEGMAVEIGGDGGFNYARDIWGSFDKVFDKERNIRFSGFVHYHDSDLTRLDCDFPQYWQDYQAVAAPRGEGTIPFRQDFGLNVFGRVEVGDTSLQVWHRRSTRSSSEGILPDFGFLDEAQWSDRSIVGELRNVTSLSEKVKLESSLTYNWYEIDPDTRFVFPATPTTWFFNDYKYGEGSSLALEEILKVEFTDRLTAMLGAVWARYDIVPKATVPGGYQHGRAILPQAGSFFYFTESGNPASAVSVPRATEDLYDTYGGYAEMNWQITDKLKTIVGARVDQDTRVEEPSYTPRAALIYELTPQLTARYAYTRAYIAPATYFSSVTFSNAAVVNVVNRGLQPEKAESHEVALSYAKENLQLGLSLYYGRQSALIKSPIRGSQGVTIDPLVFLDAAGTQPRRLVNADNGDDSKNMGLDFYGRAKFWNVSTWFSYSYVDYEEENATGEAGLPGISSHNVRLGATWAVTPNLFVTPSLVLRSTPENVDGGRLNHEMKTPWELNLNLLYAPTENIELFATLRNITDHDYALGGSRAAVAGGNPRAIPQETFAGVFGIRLTF